MKYLLDTNTCIQFLNNASSPVVRAMQSVLCQDVAICDIVKAELYFGAERSGRVEHNLEVLDGFFSVFSSLPFDGAAARIYGNIKKDLFGKGTPIGPNDLLIAAIALANDLILVTHNVDEFLRVDQLRIEDWET
ncbi:MAG: type II toxin-antitoxin system VapC family toxin [Deltaproteobacteria bacterium]|nr:type II toxin-antitoxin system VapC family toxin [Deltaproteobacteria bacterium]